MNINDIDKFKENLEKKTTKGFGYFMKNIGMVLLVFISIFILTNPTCITDPVSFFGTFKVDGLWVVFALFCSIAGFYQLARSVQKDNINNTKEERIGEYEEAMTRKAEEVRKEHAEMSIKRLIVLLLSNYIMVQIMHLDSHLFMEIWHMNRLVTM